MLIIRQEIPALSQYQFIGKVSQDHANLFTNSQLDAIGNELAELYGDRLTSSQLEQLFSFEMDFLCSLVGLADFDYLLENPQENARGSI